MPEEDFHLSDQARFQAHECGGLPPLCRTISKGESGEESQSF